MCSKLQLSNIFLCVDEDLMNITDPKVLSLNSQVLRVKLKKIKHLKKRGKKRNGSSERGEHG